MDQRKNPEKLLIGTFLFFFFFSQRRIGFINFQNQNFPNCCARNGSGVRCCHVDFKGNILHQGSQTNQFKKKVFCDRSLFKSSIAVCVEILKIAKALSFRMNVQAIKNILKIELVKAKTKKEQVTRKEFLPPYRSGVARFFAFI